MTNQTAARIGVLVAITTWVAGCAPCPDCPHEAMACPVVVTLTQELEQAAPDPTNAQLEAITAGQIYTLAHCQTEV